MNYFYIIQTDVNKYKLGHTSPAHNDPKLILQVPFVMDASILQSKWNSENPEITHEDLPDLLSFCISHLKKEVLVEPSSPSIIPESLPQDASENTLEKLTIPLLVEPHHQEYQQILQKVDSFKNNILKFQKNLESIKNLKLPTKNTQTKLEIPKVFHSERPRGQQENDFITKEDCKKWIKNKTVNPKTGRKIDVGGPTYKKFEIMTKTYGI